MAVKPVTNKQLIDSSNINRGEQVSTKGIKDKVGNSSRTIIPGSNITNNYSVTLKDIDSSVLNHVKDIMRPKIREANETVDVSVMYGNEERWKAVRKRGVMRDKNGALILPLIMLKRTTIGKNNLSGQGFDHDIKRKYATVVRNAAWSKDNRYDRFSVQTGIKPKYENLVTGVPDYTDVTYEFVLWTAYIEQMNSLIEEFVAQSNTYWGTSTNMKFLCSMDNITDASEMTQDGERFIKSTFEVVTKSYLLPEYLNSVVSNKVSNLKRELTPSRIVFGFEGDATDKQVGK